MDERAAARVAIARDALAQVESGKHRVREGTYCSPWRSMDQVNAPMGEVVRGPCTVCAIGSMLLVTMRGSHVPVEEMTSSRIGNQLAAYFSREQLGLIESAFECCGRGHALGPGSHPDWADMAAAIAYGRRRGYAHDRLVDILHNVIRNAGTFDPRDHRDGLPPEPLPTMQSAAVVDEQPAQAPTAAKAVL